MLPSFRYHGRFLWKLKTFLLCQPPLEQCKKIVSTSELLWTPNITSAWIFFLFTRCPLWPMNTCFVWWKQGKNHNYFASNQSLWPLVKLSIEQQIFKCSVSLRVAYFTANHCSNVNLINASNPHALSFDKSQNHCFKNYLK